MSRPTPQQQRAIDATGAVLLAAGAGTGKTATLVNRCVRLVTEQGVDVDRLLVVTFTNAAAAEMKQRLREALREKAATHPEDPRANRQTLLLESAHVCTIHSFCLDLVRAHFAELRLDPGVAVLDESVAVPLARNTVTRLITQAIEGDRAVQDLAESYCGSSGERLGTLVLATHRFLVTQPKASDILARELAFFDPAAPNGWRARRDTITAAWLHAVIPVARNQIPRTLDALPGIRGYGGSSPTAQGLRRLEMLLPGFDQRLRDWNPESGRAASLELLRAVVALSKDDAWVRGTGQARGALDDVFEDAELLLSWHPDGDADPVDQEWNLARGPMRTLLELTRGFAADFAEAKRVLGGIDFSDLEQLALELLLDAQGQPTAVAREWQDRLEHVFVDECQDINAAQHALIQAISRSGERANLFMVGDVKQSIYRFRMAAPELFRSDSESWQNLDHHQVLPLTENFRSRAGILAFANDLFAHLMAPRLEGVGYGPEDRLAFALPEHRTTLSLAPKEGERPGGIWPDPDCRVELHLVLAGKTGAAEPADAETDGDSGWGDLLDIERQAQAAAHRLRELMDGRHEVWDPRSSSFRPMQWKDVGLLLRSVRSRTGAFVREFQRRDIPLAVEQGDFLETIEALDLTSLLRILDNPRQDIPLFAVLRSPLAGWSLEELVEIRPSAKGGAWDGLERAGRNTGTCRARAGAFVENLRRWRRLALMTSLTCVLETVLAETRYEAYLLTLPDGPDRVANVRRFLELARRYDPLQRQGLFRFLRFLDEQTEADREIEPLPPRQTDAVRLLTIHKSKGLEFPVVVLAGLGLSFPSQEAREPILCSRRWGLAPQIVDLTARRRLDSLVLWQAKREEKLASVAEELRLFYVGITRARDTLLMVGSFNPEGTAWQARTSLPPELGVPSARCAMDWIGLWLGDRADWGQGSGEVAFGAASGASDGRARLKWRTYSEESAPNSPLAASSGEASRAASEPGLASVQHFDWRYSHEASTRTPSKTSASALRRLESVPDEEAAPPWIPRREFRTAILPGAGMLSATEIGTAHHLFLQTLEFSQTHSETALRAEADRLRAAGRLTEAEVAVLDLGSIAAFWNSPLGAAIRDQADCVRRELPFTALFAPSELPAFAVEFETTPGSADDGVVVQGAIDLAVLLRGEIWVVDFKTDRVSAEELPERAKEHARQLGLYAAALERAWRLPVTRRVLYFIAHRRVWEIEEP